MGSEDERPPRPDEYGHPSFVHDITDLKRAQEDLRLARERLEHEAVARTTELKAREASETMLRDLFESSPDAIAVIESGGRIARVNTRAEMLFGYSRQEMIGQPVEMLMPDRFRDRHVHHRSEYTATPRTRPMGAGLDLYGRRKDGSEFAVDIMLSPMQSAGGGAVIAVVRDATERRRDEQKIRESLEKEALLRRELHHRVKNNLQVISSMLFLQSTHVSDPKTLEALRESRNRTRAIGLIHERLYHSGDLAKIDLSTYLPELAADLFAAYRVSPETIALKTSTKGVVLDLDSAIPCGLIVNELVSNALKHGFPEGRKGTLSIDLDRSERGLFRLVVRDDGVGLPEDFDYEKTPTLGLKLVRDLTQQLDGQIDFDGNHGTTITITFAEARKDASGRTSSSKLSR